MGPQPATGFCGLFLCLLRFLKFLTSEAFMPTPPRWTRIRRNKFLAHLAATANISASAKFAKMSRSSAYRLRQTDPDFAEAWDEALDAALDDLEEVLMRRALNGVDKQVYYAGKPIGTTRSYSDSLAMFLLKSRRPEVYGDVTAARKLQNKSQQDDNPADPVERLRSRLAEMESRQAAAKNIDQT
jgi:hypothetical protein